MAAIFFAPAWAMAQQATAQGDSSESKSGQVQQDGSGQGGAEDPLRPITRSESFETALGQIFRLDPDEIRTLLSTMDARQRAVAESRDTVMEARSALVSTRSGEVAPTVTLAPGYTTVLTLIDSTGSPWPIRSAVIGDESTVAITDPGGQFNNMITLTPRETYARTNLVVVLEEAESPLTVMLDTNAEHANNAVALQMDRRGPNARVHAISAPLPKADDDVMRSIVDGVKPEGVRLISVVGGDATGYRYGDRMYVRTQMDLRWPAPVSVIHGVDGVRVYEVPPQAMMVASSRDGQVHRLRVADVGLLLDDTLAGRSPDRVTGSIIDPLAPNSGAYGRSAPGATQGQRRIVGSPQQQERPRGQGSSGNPAGPAPRARAQ